MGRRRDKIEMIHDILHICLKPSRTTYILRLGNIQYNVFKEMMPQLESMNYVEKTEVIPRRSRSRSYYLWHTTRMGSELMNEIGNLMDKTNFSGE